VAEDNGDEAKTLSSEAMEQLCHANYPGNVRQLENTLARAAAMSETAVIGIEDLEELTPASNPMTASPVVASNAEEPSGSLDAATSLSAVAGDLEGHMDSLERQILQKAMTEYRWNKTAAAKGLGVSFRSLRYRLKKLGLDD
jgi:two-component system response regulator PilR (NtrC family)